MTQPDDLPTFSDPVRLLAATQAPVLVPGT